WYQPGVSKKFTPKQGQYLAFIYYYTKVNGRAPAESDMQNYFHVTPPTVHKMVLELEKRGLIARTPRQPRSITLLVSRSEIPDLA
ncbi:MAG: LexA family protein, partial [Anaerolineae bacterium]